MAEMEHHLSKQKEHAEAAVEATKAGDHKLAKQHAQQSESHANELHSLVKQAHDAASGKSKKEPEPVDHAKVNAAHAAIHDLHGRSTSDDVDFDDIKPAVAKHMEGLNKAEANEVLKKYSKETRRSDVDHRDEPSRAAVVNEIARSIMGKKESYNATRF